MASDNTGAPRPFHGDEWAAAARAVAMSRLEQFVFGVHAPLGRARAASDDTGPRSGFPTPGEDPAPPGAPDWN